MPTTAAEKGLCIHCGGYRVEYPDVRTLPDPSPLSDQHVPIRHDYFVDALRSALTSHGYSVTDEAHALWGENGLRYFGILCLAGNDLPVPTSPSESGSEWQFVLGIRNSHDMSFAASALGGTYMPFVCDNLCWSGGNVVKIARKHTLNIKRDLEGVIHQRLGEVARMAIDVEARFDAYKSFDFASPTPLLEQQPSEDWALDPEQAHDWNEEQRRNCRLANGARFILDAASARAIAPTRTTSVWSEFSRPDGPGGHPTLAGGTGWTMLNAFTEVEKQYPSLLEGPRRNSRLTSLLDATCNLQTTLTAIDE